MSNLENVLILQGGGSLGAFGCGVFKSLVKAHIHPVATTRTYESQPISFDRYRTEGNLTKNMDAAHPFQESGLPGNEGNASERPTDSGKP